MTTDLEVDLTKSQLCGRDHAIKGHKLIKTEALKKRENIKKEEKVPPKFWGDELIMGGQDQ